MQVVNLICLFVVVISTQFGSLALIKCARKSKIKTICAISTLNEHSALVKQDLVKLSWNPSGFNRWKWNDHHIHFIEMGGTDGSNNKPPLLLIHGFGASVFHWRYNIPALSCHFHVFAMDLLGFGLSDKPIIEYSADVWRDQATSFIREVVQYKYGHKQPCIVAGNSLGGYVALSAAANQGDSLDLIRGCILLNAAGRFRDPSKPELVDNSPAWLQGLRVAVQRVVIGLSFLLTKQPARVEQILRQVYLDSTNVDEELVQSIVHPSTHPNAAEVYYRVISRNGMGPMTYIDDLLATLRVPLLLLWGEKDPWIRPAAADKIQSLYPAAQRVGVEAGHCPHDESPSEVNEEIIRFANSLQS